VALKSPSRRCDDADEAGDPREGSLLCRRLSELRGLRSLDGGGVGGRMLALERQDKTITEIAEEFG
jgi:hypothetical protein